MHEGRITMKNLYFIVSGFQSCNYKIAVVIGKATFNFTVNDILKHKAIFQTIHPVSVNMEYDFPTNTAFYKFICNDTVCNRNAMDAFLE